jgi:hypothetical protein
VEHYEDLLDLDPDDHLDSGTILLGSYLAMGEIQRAWDLLEELDDGEDLVAAWAWVLLLLLNDEDEAARESLDHAMDLNPYVATWLVGLGDPEVESPAADWVEPGSEDEAIICADILGEGWSRTPDVQWWLHDVLVDLGLLDAPDEGLHRPRGPVN